MSILSILLAILIIGLILYAISLLPLPVAFKRIAYVLALVLLILWLVGAVPLR